jgi:penicillin-binding protein 1A
MSAERTDKKKRGSRKTAARRPHSKRMRLALRALAILVFLGSATLLSVIALLAYYGRDLPAVDARRYDPPQVTRVLDRKGRVIAELFDQRRTVVPMSRVPRVLVLAVLAAEDADFYRHRGLDYPGIVRALARDLLTGKPMQGASTITQQIVKNLFLTPERTVARKVKELILARRLEQELGKDQILHLYLNHIYFGHGRYGVQEAARFFFGKDVESLTLAEAALLAGLPQAPERLSPLRHPKAAKQRRSYVLDQLASKRAAYWSDLPLEEITAARKTEINLAPAPKLGGAPEVAAFAKQALEQLVGIEKAKHGGYRIETTIDLDLQRKAREALRRGLVTMDERAQRLGPLKPPKARAKLARVRELSEGRTYDAIVVGHDDRAGRFELDIGGKRATASLADLARWNPKALAPSAFAPVGTRVRASIVEDAIGTKQALARMELGPRGAVVVIDPRTRDVLALVGSDEEVYGFDRALHAVRQPGSAFKAVTYALAIQERKYTPATLVLDAPEVFDEWKPDNYETWTYAGAVRLREAVAQSINLVAVRVMSDLTPAKVVQFAERIGIRTPLDPSLALALGASGVRPIELVNAYATFAAGGRYAPYRVLRSVRSARGKAVRLPESEPARDVLDPEAAYVLTSMLQSVIQEGTAKAARKLNRPAAGKTGTSNNSRDAWFVGYTPDLVAGVWVGFDDHRPLGKGESGGKSAVPIWTEVMQAALQERPAVEFPVPSGIERVAIDRTSGLRAYEGSKDALEEVFVAGTAPTEVALPPDVLDSDDFLREQLGGSTPTTGETARAP